MNSGEMLEENETADGSLRIRSHAISAEMMAEVDQQPLNLTVSNSFGGKKVSEEKSCQAVPIKVERMDEEAESSTTNDVQDFDIYSAMEWKNGVGSLPGSDLKPTGQEELKSSTMDSVCLLGETSTPDSALD
ncbi:uncharacterized protein LOC144593227 [Rhinoraja longicauda]